MHALLFYDYVQDMLERRVPWRDAHFAWVKGFVDRGELLLGGAFTDPADGAVIAFRVRDLAQVEAFARGDPYVVQGLVTAWRIREWNAVVGSAL